MTPQNSLEPTRGGIGYSVDLVLCIDASSSMNQVIDGQRRIIDAVKEHALKFCADLEKKIKARGKSPEQLRVRVILFRDYIGDGKNSIMGTDFFDWSEQRNEIEACIRSIKAFGGSGGVEDGLEALAYAMRSDWTKIGTKRHIIVVWSDAGTHPLGYGKYSPFYPKNMPKTMAELEAIWDKVDYGSKRLIMFVPDANYWNRIADSWDNVVHVPSVAGIGIAKETEKAIVDVIFL